MTTRKTLFAAALFALIPCMVALLFLPRAAEAATVSITLTSAEVDVATWKWNQIDPTHVKYATAPAFIQAAMVQQLIAVWAAERAPLRKDATKNYFCNTAPWPGWTQPQKDTWCTSNGESASCNPCQ